MAKPMIENSDRGITIAKGLAWTIVATFVTLAFYTGNNLSDFKNATENLGEAIKGMQEEMASTREAAKELSTRVRFLENSYTRQDEKFLAIQSSIIRLEKGQQDTNDLLRSLKKELPR